MQKANGLQLKFGGASCSSLMSGMVLGYSCHPHTINNYEKSLAKANTSDVRKKVHLEMKVVANNLNLPLFEIKITELKLHSLEILQDYLKTNAKK